MLMNVALLPPSFRRRLLFGRSLWHWDGWQCFFAGATFCSAREVNNSWLVERLIPPTTLAEAIALHVALRAEERIRIEAEPSGELPDDLQSLYADRIVGLEERIAAADAHSDDETVVLLGWLANYVVADGNGRVASQVARNVAGAIGRRYAPANN